MASLADLHQAATRRWPAVIWPLERFTQHVNGELPAYGEDLYLAGAAGWRIANSWETLSREFGAKTQQVLQRFPKADCAVEDLWSEILTRLMDDDPEAPAIADGSPCRCARIYRYRGRVPLLGYLVTIARRLAIARKRSAQVRTSVQMDGSPEHLGSASDSPAENAQRSELLGLVVKAFRAACSGLTDDERFLVRMVYVQGITQRQAAAMLGWSEFKTCRALKAVTEKLAAVMAKAAPEAATSDLRVAWAQLVEETLNSLQDHQPHASEATEKGVRA